MGGKKPPTRIDWTIGIDSTVPTFNYVEGGPRNSAPEVVWNTSPPRVYLHVRFFICVNSTTLLRNQTSTTGPEKLHCKNPQKLFLQKKQSTTGPEKLHYQNFQKLFLQEKQSTTGHWSRKNPLPKIPQKLFLQEKLHCQKSLRKGFNLSSLVFLGPIFTFFGPRCWGRNGPWALQRRLVLIPSSPQQKGSHTLPQFNSSPLKSYQNPNRQVVVLQPPNFFRGYVETSGGV